MWIIGDPLGEGAGPLAELGPGGLALAVRPGRHEQTRRLLDQRDPAQEVPVRLALYLLHPTQGVTSIVLGAFRLAALQRMRSNDPEKAVAGAQAFDIHLAFGTCRQVDEPVESEMPMLAKPFVLHAPQPLDARRLVASEKETVANANDGGQVLMEWIFYVSQLSPV